MDALLSTWDDDDDDKKPLALPGLKRDTFRDLVIEMWSGGVRDLEEIRNETGYSLAYIRKLLKDAGFQPTTVAARSEQDIDQICHDYLTFPSIRAVLKKWNISNNTLYAILDMRGVPLKSMGGRSKQESKDHAVQMYIDGVTLKDIFVTTGIPAPSLYQELAIRGIPVRREAQGDDNSAEVEEAIKMYQANQPLIVIQSRTGVSLTSLYNALSVRQIPRRRGSNVDARLNTAVEMYMEKKQGEEIVQATGIGSSVLYRELANRGVELHKNRSQADVDLALRLYDEGATSKEILRTAKITFGEFMHHLNARGGRLRTGLGFTVGTKHMEYAIEAYRQSVDYDTIEMDTLIKRPALLAALKKKGIALRP